MLIESPSQPEYTYVKKRPGALNVFIPASMVWMVRGGGGVRGQLVVQRSKRDIERERERERASKSERHFWQEGPIC